MRIAGLSLLAIFFPVYAHAAVIVSEIMYDVPTSVGADDTREWVEITNTGSVTVDLTGWKFNDGSNHVLNAPPANGGTGSLSLGPNASAILADNASVFATLYPSFSGTLIDTTMSLNNTGATLQLIDQSGAIANSATYAKTMGAAGDGNTLQWNGSAFTAGTPTPGTYSGGQSNTASTTQETASVVSSGAGTYTPPPSNLVLTVTGSRVALLEVPLRLSARASAKSGAPDSVAQISWSFGDGSYTTGSEIQKVYHYAGTYLITVTATDGMAKAYDELIVTVKPAAPRIAAVSTEGITIANDSTDRLDLSDWRLMSDGNIFRIPQGTTILPKMSVLFPYTITNLTAASEAVLAYPDGVTAARYPLPSAQNPMQPEPEAAVVVEQPPAQTLSYTRIQADTAPIISKETNIQEHVAAALAPAVTVQPAAAGAATLPKAASTQNPLHSPWTLGLLGVIAIAGGAFILL